MTDYLYRYYDYITGNGVDQFENTIPGTNVNIGLHKYKVIKLTPKGCWIEYYNNSGKKFVRANCIKQFAHRDKMNAKLSFMARKRKQIKILYDKLRNAEMALEKITFTEEYK